MNGYSLTFIVPEDGSVLFDLHNGSGTSRIARFESVHDLDGFLSSVGLQQDKIAELIAACNNLRAGEAYHESMYLPDLVIQAVETASARG